MARREFGPNQAQVDQLLDRLESVDQGQAMFLAGMAGDDPTRTQARSAMLQAARRGRRERELKAAQNEVKRWVNSWFTGGFQISGYGRDITPAEAAVKAAPVVLDAIGALVVADLLSRDEVEALTGAWNELDARPEPPEPSG